MLAQIEQQDGVGSVEADRRGEFLRVDVEGEDIAAVIGKLRALGFAAERTTDSTADRQWYRREDVGELSREEAAVIARRVVPALARAHHKPADQADTLTDLVAMTLHRCFVTNVLNANSPRGTLHTKCRRAVEAATRAQLGTARAGELGKAIEADVAAGRSERGG